LGVLPITNQETTMATALQYGAIAAVISFGVVTVVTAVDSLRPKDPIKEHYERIDRECAKPTPDGRRRDIAWTDNDGSYVVCPRH
jgi:hypothetical protein